MDQLAIKPEALAEMIRLIEDTTISGKIAKDILPELLEGKGNGGVKVRRLDREESGDLGAGEQVWQHVRQVRARVSHAVVTLTLRKAGP